MAERNFGMPPNRTAGSLVLSVDLSLYGASIAHSVEITGETVRPRLSAVARAACAHTGGLSSFAETGPQPSAEGLRSVAAQQQ